MSTSFCICISETYLYIILDFNLCLLNSAYISHVCMLFYCLKLYTKNKLNFSEYRELLNLRANNKYNSIKYFLKFLFNLLYNCYNIVNGLKACLLFFVREYFVFFVFSF